MGDGRYCWRCAAPLPGAPPVSCTSCGQEHYNNPRPAAEAVVVCDGDVLLIQRAYEPWQGCWDIPGGFVEPDEHPRRTAERELREETGLQGSSGDLLGIWIDHYGPPDPDGMPIVTLNLAYDVELHDPRPTAGHDGEATAMAWFPLDGTPSQLAFPEHACDVLDAARDRLDL